MFVVAQLGVPCLVAGAELSAPRTRRSLGFVVGHSFFLVRIPAHAEGKRNTTSFKLTLCLNFP